MTGNAVLRPKARPRRQVLDRDPPLSTRARYGPLHFYERPTWVPVFSNRKKPEEDFFFDERRCKAKTALSVCSAGAVQQRCVAQAAGRPANQLIPRASLSTSDPASRARNCEQLCFTTIYSMHPLARCVLRCQKKPERSCFWGLGMPPIFPYQLMATVSSLEAILADKRCS